MAGGKPSTGPSRLPPTGGPAGPALTAPSSGQASGEAYFRAPRPPTVKDKRPGEKRQRTRARPLDIHDSFRSIVLARGPVASRRRKWAPYGAFCTRLGPTPPGQGSKRPSRSARVSPWCSNHVDDEVGASDKGHLAYVSRVRGDNGVTAPYSALDHGHVNDVVVLGARCKATDGSRVGFREVVYVTALQEPRQRCLRATTPALGQHPGWDSRGKTPCQGSAMEGPHKPVVPLGCDQSTGVVGKAFGAHALRAGRASGPPSSWSSSTSPAALSSGVRAPASASQSLTPRRPSRTRS